MEAVACPACRSSLVTIGLVRSVEIGRADHFEPNHSSKVRGRPGVPLVDLFHACSACGHVWSRVDPERLRVFVDQHGDELAKQDLDPNRSPWPDHPEAIAAMEKLAEIDALARAGRMSTVNRNVRELAGLSWDRAIVIGAGWREMTLPAKLAIFGWKPKGWDRENRPDHPLLDREIDG